MVTSSSFFKRWYIVLFFFAISLPAEAQASNIPNMIKI